MLCLVAQSCLTLCNSMDCIPPGSSVHGNSPGKNVKSGLPCPPSGNLPNPGSNPGLLCPPGPDPDVSWVSLPSHPPVCRSSLRGVCMEGAGRASAGAWPSQWDASYYYSFTFCFLLTLARYLYSRGQRAWMPRIPKPRGIFIKYRLPGPNPQFWVSVYRVILVKHPVGTEKSLRWAATCFRMFLCHCRPVTSGSW